VATTHSRTSALSATTTVLHKVVTSSSSAFSFSPQMEGTNAASKPAPSSETVTVVATSSAGKATFVHAQVNLLQLKQTLRSRYEGRCATTKSGRKCQSWNADTPHKPKYRPQPHDHNFCREFLYYDRAPWCYTLDPEKRWEYCDPSTCKRMLKCCSLRFVC